MMTRRQFYVALAVLAVAGLVGGVLGDWLLPGRTAWAQAESRPLEPPPTQAASAAKEVRAERFVVVDEAGRERGMLGCVGGGPALMLCDELGRTQAALSIVDDKPGLWLRDGSGHTRASLSLADGAPALALRDDASRGRAALALMNGEPRLWLDDAAGQNRVVVGSTETEDTRTGAIIKYPISTITLFTETGRVLWQAP